MKETTKKRIKLALNVAWYVLLVLLAILTVNICSARMRGEVPKLFGYSVIRIEGVSMGETIPYGTYILIKETPPEDIGRDDVICFYSSDPSIYGHPNTHRVIEDPIPVGDGFEYKTKGDGNLLPDNYTAKSDKLIGRYVRSLDVLTAMLSFITTNAMLIVFIVIQIICVFIVISTLIIKKKNNNGQDS